MAEEEEQQHEPPSKHQPNENEGLKKLVSSYVGLGLGLYLALLPKNALSAVQKLQGEVREMRWRRQEDSKANARVVEIFASHRNAWQNEEKRLLRQIDAAADEIARLHGTLDDLRKDGRAHHRHDDFISRRMRGKNGEKKFQEEEVGLGSRVCRSRECYGVGAGNSSGGAREWFRKEEEEEEEDEDEEEECVVVGSTRRVEEDEVTYEHEHEHERSEMFHHEHVQQYHELGNGFDSEFMASASKLWAEKASLWQDVQYEPLESIYNTKHFVARRESPWKADGDSVGVSSKLKLLEQELLNLEKISKSDLSKVSSLIKNQAKRYQGLSEKIDDLCRRIAGDPSEPTLSSEFRAQTQTEFLLEAFRLQQGASETGQKLLALQTEIGKSHYRDELSEATLTTRRSLDSIRNNFKEIQRNLEIWLARIIGDLEGILARDGASREVNDCASISKLSCSLNLFQVRHMLRVNTDQGEYDVPGLSIPRNIIALSPLSWKSSDFCCVMQVLFDLSN